jgi:prefoldin beta subunit
MAEPTLSPAVQQQLAQLQSQGSQLQATQQQRAQFEAMKAEGDQAVAALEALADDAPVYRNVGAFLVKEPGKAAALARLKEDQETLEIRIARLQKQEAALRESLQALQAKLQGALPG